MNVIIEAELLPMEVFHCENKNFRVVPVTLTLTRWTSYTNLTSRYGSSGDIAYGTWENELPIYVKAFESYRITVSESVHFVMRGHLRSHYSIHRSRKPYVARKHHGSMFSRIGVADRSRRPNSETKDPCVDGSVHHLRRRLKQWIR